jgi:hypothetical protein
VDAACKALLIGNLLQESSELLSIALVECVQQRILVLAGDTPDGSQGRATLVSEVERVPATVMGVCAPLDQTTRFEFVEKRHQAAGQHAQRGREGLLR